VVEIDHSLTTFLVEKRFNGEAVLIASSIRATEFSNFSLGYIELTACLSILPLE
jgi:hypothetical protein